MSMTTDGLDENGNLKWKEEIHKDDSFNLIKRDLVEEIKKWRIEQQGLNILLTGGVDPKNGIVYRVDKLEEFQSGMIKQKENRDKQIAGTITGCLIALATALGDFVLRMIHHK